MNIINIPYLQELTYMKWNVADKYSVPHISHLCQQNIK